MQYSFKQLTYADDKDCDGYIVRYVAHSKNPITPCDIEGFFNGTIKKDSWSGVYATLLTKEDAESVRDKNQEHNLACRKFLVATNYYVRCVKIKDKKQQ